MARGIACNVVATNSNNIPRCWPDYATSDGVNPEQLSAAGYSACFVGAMRFAAGRHKAVLPADTRVDGAVAIGPTASSFGIDVELKISIPGFDRVATQALVDKAHQLCPYSNATRGNINVSLVVL